MWNTIAQLTVVPSNAEGLYISDEVIGSLFVHDVWEKDLRRSSGLWPMGVEVEPLGDPI